MEFDSKRNKQHGFVLTFSNKNNKVSTMSTKTQNQITSLHLLLPQFCSMAHN